MGRKEWEALGQPTELYRGLSSQLLVQQAVRVQGAVSTATPPGDHRDLYLSRAPGLAALLLWVVGSLRTRHDAWPHVISILVAGLCAGSSGKIVVS